MPGTKYLDVSSTMSPYVENYFANNRPKTARIVEISFTTLGNKHFSAHTRTQGNIKNMLGNC